MKRAFEEGLHQPIIGDGPQSYQTRAVIPESVYLEALVNTGIVGMIGMLLFGFGPTRMLRRHLDGTQRAAVSALVAFGAASTFGGYPFDAKLMPLWWLVFAIAVARPGPSLRSTHEIAD
jgi:hypothetical protein